MKSIWFDHVSVATLNEINARDMLSRLGVVYTDVSADTLFAEFRVDERTCQAHGLLHGGVSCAVSESMGSVGANLCVDRGLYRCVGVDLNATHLRSATSGTVRARCAPIRIGRRNHVWQTELFDAGGRQLCVSRLTVAVIDIQ